MRRIALIGLPMSVLAACGSSTNNSPAATATPVTASTATATPAPTATPVPTPTATAAPAGVSVGTGSTTSAGTVLVDAQGRTLYRFTAEASGSIACTGSCVSIWRPLVLPQGQQVSPQGSLPGHFASMARPEGTEQVTYNGWPLYTYSGDTAAGQATGNGVAGKWFAATPNQAARPGSM